MTKNNNRGIKLASGKSRKGMKRPERQAAELAEPVKVSIRKVQETPVERIEHSIEEIKAFDVAKINQEVKRRKTSPAPESKMSAREIKEQEIKKAVQATNRSFSGKKSHRHYKKMDFGFRKVALAMLCAAVAVFVIVYFVNSNSPDISLKVAAMQTGIDAHYPEYIPRGFALSDITSENGKITLNFKNSSDGDAFSLVEEKVDWNSDEFYNNFVRQNYGDNYVLISENNLNVYISGSNAAWLSDGIFYKITTTSGSLTKKQLSTIAAKL